MSAADVAALVASIAAAVAAVASCFVIVALARLVGELREMVRRIDEQAVPLVREARAVMDHAATEMERVEDVLASTEAISETVDSASRLAYRALANPVVKVLAFGTGLGSAIRRVFSRRRTQRPHPGGQFVAFQRANTSVGKGRIEASPASAHKQRGGFRRKQVSAPARSQRTEPAELATRDWVAG